MTQVRRQIVDIGLASEMDVAGSLEVKVLMGVEPMVRGYGKALERLAAATSGGTEKGDGRLCRAL